MTYAALLPREGIKSEFLVVMKPRRLVTSYTSVSGTKYYASFDYGYVTGVDQDGAALTEASDSNLSDGDWYFDASTGRIYIDIGVDPTTVTIVATYEIFCATNELIWHRDPTDATSDEVYFAGIVNQLPEVNYSTGDTVFGYIPRYTGELVIDNMEGEFLRHLDDGSFNKADFKVYHLLAEPGREWEAGNASLILSGYLGNIIVKDDDLSFAIHDRFDIFDKIYSPAGENSAATGSSSLSGASFHRKVYGFVERIDCATRYYKYRPNGEGDLIKLGWTTTNQTSTRVYVTDASKVRVGDYICWFTRNAKNYTAGVKVTAVNTSGSHYIDHTTRGGGTIATNTHDLYLMDIRDIYVIRQGELYEPVVDTDFEFYCNPTSVGSDYEMHAGILVEATGFDFDGTIMCSVYGEPNTVTLGGVAFGSDDATYKGVLTNPIVILLDVIKKAGVPESEIDADAFTALVSTKNEPISFAIPFYAGGPMPTYREVIARICQTLLIRFYYSAEGKWTISEIEPLGDNDRSIDNSEIFNRFDVAINYSDIVSDVIVRYDQKGYNAYGVTGDFFSYSKSTSTTAQYLHKQARAKVVDSLHKNSANAATLAERLGYMLGDRQATYRFTAKHDFLDADINEVVEVSREKMPGYAYTSGTNRARDLLITSKNRKLREVEFELDDQKGIEDNAGDW